jgi:hypothetical protein
LAEIKEHDGTITDISYLDHEFTNSEKDMINSDVGMNHPSARILGDPSHAYDCHGFTFKAGSVWIDDNQVDKILVDQGWKIPADGKAKVDDIVIYRDAFGNVTHSGIVTGIDGQGNVTRVVSKWGSEGRYIHDPNDVPSSYGGHEVRTGGKPLIDPPPPSEDIGAFQFIPPAFLKSSLLATDRNVFPSASLDLVFHQGGNYSYELQIPPVSDPRGLAIAVGDELTLYAAGILSASVVGAPLSSAFGNWVVSDQNADHVTWMATSVGFLSPGSFGLFSITSLYASADEAFFRETVAGDIGRTSGPVVPEPSGLIMFVTGFSVILGFQFHGRKFGQGGRHCSLHPFRCTK